MAARAGASVVGGANCGQPSATDWFCSACEEATCSLCRGLARSTTASTHTHTCSTILWPLVRDYPGKPVPEETFTHSHPSWWSDILYQLPPFTTIYSIPCVQFMCLTVLFDNLSPGPIWSSSWALCFILHAFLYPVIIFFTQHMPIPLQPSTTILQLLASTNSEPKMTPTEDLGQTDHVNMLSNHSVLSAAATAWSSLTALLQNATSLPPYRCKLNTPWHPMSTVTSQWKPTATFLQAGCYSWRPTNSVKALKTTKLREVLI